MAFSIFGGPSKRGDLEFLPAALEIVEKPAPPFARSLLLFIVLSISLAVAWTWWAQTDIVVVASGKIVPTGFSKTIQPLEIGIVRRIDVEDGQAVRKGDLLIEIDPQINEAERDRVANDLASAELDMARLRAMSSADPLGAFRPAASARPRQITTHQQLLANQVSELRAKLDVLDNQHRAKEQELKTSNAMIDKIKSILQVIQQRVDIRKTLLDSGNGSKVTYLEILQNLVELQKELAVQEARAREIDAALVALESARRQTLAEQQRKTFEDLAEAERKAASLSHDFARADQRTRLQQLRAPIDGVVQQLAVHTVGGVVTPAQTLMMVVPSISPLEIVASLSNSDIGFIQEGQAVEIKVAAFPFTRYGLLSGRVKTVSRDSITQDQPAGRAKANAPVSGSDTGGLTDQDSSSYAARITLDQTQMRADDRTVDLGAGMAVTVEIKTGTRRVMSYLLSPLARYGHDALHER